MAARCQFAHSYELALGKWQPDANLILGHYRQLQLNRNPGIGSEMPIQLLFWIGNWQLAARCQSDRGLKAIKDEKKTGKRKTDANLLILMNWQLAARYQFGVRGFKKF